MRLARPGVGEAILKFAEEKNEIVERALLSHTSMDVPRKARSRPAKFSVVFRLEKVPVWDEATRGPWRLEVGGMVAKPLQLSLADLGSLPRTGYRLDHFCVEGWTAVAVRTGVRLSDLARVAGVDPTHATSTSNRSTTTITRAGTSRARCIHKRSSCTRRMAAT